MVWINDQVSGLGPMPPAQWEAQPASLWRAVQDTILRHYPINARAAVGLLPGEPCPDGWLTRPVGERLTACDVPVGRLFTAFVLRERREA